MPSSENTGYLVQLKSPEGENVYPIISAEMIKDKNGETYNLSELKEAVNNASVSDGLPLNDIRKYEIKTGTTVAVGDVVDITRDTVSGSVFGDLDVGSIVNIAENSLPVQYIVVHQGNPDESMYDASCDGTWLLRQDIAENRAWDNDDGVNYSTSDVNTYLNEDWMSRYDSSISSIIKQVKVPYADGTEDFTAPPVETGANGVSVKAFLLGIYELGYTTAIDEPRFVPVDGAKLDYFNNTASDPSLCIAKLNNAPAEYYTRTPMPDSIGAIWYINESGATKNNPSSGSRGIRPCIIVSKTAQVPGTTVAYGKEKVTKESGHTSMGIALDSGGAGDMVRVCFGGYCECSTATTGQIITGTGIDPVKAQSPKNGWLWVNPIHQYYSITGGVVHEPFAEASWDEIASVSEAGLAAEVYNLGDTKDIEISGIGTMTLEIADFNHDYLSGSTSADKAGISLITKDLLPSPQPMNRMLSNDGGFPASDLYDYLNTTILNGLPTDLNNHVKMIYKWYGTGGGTTDGEWHGCKVWVPLEYEFFGDETHAPSTEHSTGNARQYPIFTDNASRIKKLNNGSGSANWYWEASPVESAATTFCNVTSSGNADGFSANNSRAVCFGLSI